MIWDGGYSVPLPSLLTMGASPSPCEVWLIWGLFRPPCQILFQWCYSVLPNLILMGATPSACQIWSQWGLLRPPCQNISCHDLACHMKICHARACLDKPWHVRSYRDMSHVMMCHDMTLHGNICRITPWNVMPLINYRSWNGIIWHVMPCYVQNKVNNPQLTSLSTWSLPFRTFCLEPSTGNLPFASWLVS